MAEENEHPLITKAKQRRAKLIDERDNFVKQANANISFWNGSISELDELIGDKPKPVTPEQSPTGATRNGEPAPAPEAQPPSPPPAPPAPDAP